MDNIFRDPRIAILSIIIIVSILNYFMLNLILTLIYDLLLLFILYFHFFHPNNEEDYGTFKEKISMILMGEAVTISFSEFYYENKKGLFGYIYFFIFPEKKNIKVDISPNMLTLIISILCYLSFKIRLRLSISTLFKDICLNVLNLLFFSSLLSVLFSNNYFYIPIIGETSYSPQSFCLILLIISWAGMKSLNIFIFPLIAILSLGRIGEVNKAMGKVGILYLLLAYVSIVLQVIGNTFIKKLYSDSMNEIKKDFYFNDTDANNNNNDNLYKIF